MTHARHVVADIDTSEAPPRYRVEYLDRGLIGVTPDRWVEYHREYYTYLLAEEQAKKVSRGMRTPTRVIDIWAEEEE